MGHFLQSGVIKNGAGDVEAGYQLGAGEATGFFGGIGIENETRKLGGEIVEKAFATHAVVAHQQAVIAAENNQRFPGEIAFLQAGDNLAHHLIDLGDHLVIAHVQLVAHLRVVAEIVGLVPALVVIDHAARNVIVGIRIGVERRLDFQISIRPGFAKKRMIRQIGVVEGRLRELLPHQAKLGAVRRGVAKRKAERLVFRGAVDEGKGIIGFLLVGRDLGFISAVAFHGEQKGTVPVMTVKDIEQIFELEALLLINVPFPDQSRVVTRLFQHHRIASLPLLAGQLSFRTEADPVDSLVASQQQRSPAGATDRLGDVGIGKPGALLQQVIDMRCLDPRMPHSGKGIVTLIIGEDKQNVREFFGDGLLCERGKRKQDGKDAVETESTGGTHNRELERFR